MQAIHDLTDAPPANLAKLFDLVADRPEADFSYWREDDYASILNHLLASPLLLTAGGDCEDDDATPSWSSRHETSVATLAEVLFAADPDAELLRLIKNYAKREYRAKPASLPGPVALMLYYLSIAVAISRTAHRITDLDGASLAEGWRWALAQPWIDRPVRATLEAAMSHVAAR